ncbi:MAG: class I SAM-dependent rRNA methyltransferase [Planctomycetes bacterium]|nr:class I SAM-dependent rRNA methyltransferase [Planctomycetota bacterium]
MKTVLLKGAEVPRSPRIYMKRLRRPEAQVRPGEEVEVRTEKGAFVGRGFYSPRSVYGVRIYDRNEKGPPLDGEWLKGRVRAAAELRRSLRIEETTDAYRVVHAEGDGLSGLVVDRYADAAVVEVGARGIFERLDDLEEALREVLGARKMVVRADPDVEEIEGFRGTERGAEPVRVIVREGALRFHVDCRGGHKTGFFCDQRESRAEVARLAKGRRVLDLCCYTGGFALAAAKGGAREVLGVDLDEEAVALARENAALNKLDVPFEHADAFDFLRKGPRPDLIVLDPPKLAARREDLPRARKKSVDLNALALGALGPEGLLFTFSCTGLFSAGDFESQVREAAARAGRDASVLRATGQPPDHPVDLSCPETRYLSGLLLRVR